MPWLSRYSLARASFRSQFGWEIRSYAKWDFRCQSCGLAGRTGRSFDWAQALRPLHPAYNGAINSLPALLDRICLSRFAILEKAKPGILPKLSACD